MKKKILKFLLNDKLVEIDFEKERFLPSTTVLNYLRMQPGLRGVKEGCAEGDCGACTVVLAELDGESLTYKAVDSCLLFLASIHGKQLITVEYLAENEGNKINLHPVQQAMIDHHGSQCGFCTPGFVMSLFGLYKSEKEANDVAIVDAFSGNLCRCTGYKPIAEAAHDCCKNKADDHFTRNQTSAIERLNQIKSDTPILKLHHLKQDYFLPSTLAEALQLKMQYPESVMVNGATDTAIRQNKTFAFLPSILDLSAINELKINDLIGDKYILGSGINIEQLTYFAEHNYPEMLPILKVFASHQIRNVATLGGNLSTASPIGDLIPLLFALKAEVIIARKEGGRTIPIEEYFTGYRQTCLKKDEILEAIIIPVKQKGVQIVSEKISTRLELDISTVSIAMRLKCSEDNRVEEIILAFGGMAAMVKRSATAEDFLIGKEWTMQNIESASQLIENEFAPLSDARSTAVYRKKAAGNLLHKMFLKTQTNVVKE